MLWNLEELVEDALAAYLAPLVGGSMRVYAAWSVDEPQFPNVTIFAGESGPISEPAAWHDARQVLVDVAVMTEAAPELDAAGSTVTTAREKNATARSVVMNSLAVSDLSTRLNKQGIDGIAFDMAQVTTSNRSVDGRVLITTIRLEVIAEPVEGSA